MGRPSGPLEGRAFGRPLRFGVIPATDAPCRPCCDQRYVSPYKGFCCAYRAHTGRASCSVLGYRAVRRHGVFAGLALVRQRTYRCGVAPRRYRLRPDPALHAQRGDCDVSCDLPCDGGCDLPNGGGASDVCDWLSCCDCSGCDWPDRKRKSPEAEQYVYIPPNSRRRVEPGSGPRMT